MDAVKHVGHDQKGDEPRNQLLIPWVLSLKAALNHGGTRRPKRDRKEAKRKHVQLATVDPDTGWPSVRTVGFRGFLQLSQLDLSEAGTELGNDTCALLFVTDDRADKVRHILDSPMQPHAEVCWWLDEASVQFRISGEIAIATYKSSIPFERALAKSVWMRLQPSTRATFSWPQPGRIQGSSDKDESSSKPESTQHWQADCGEELSTSLDLEGLEQAHFAVVVLVPKRVDELHLGGRQKRRLHTLECMDVNSSTKRRELLDLVQGLLNASWNVQDVNP